MQGLTHIYYGNGKGKTTAALGLALRAAGCGRRVVFVQFLKDWNCGELPSLERLGITVLRGQAPGGVFAHEMTDEQKAETTAIHNANLKQAVKLQEQGECDLLVLDEALDAHSLGLLDSALFEGLLTDKPAELELVITGHKPDQRHLEFADYVTEMVKRRHPYDKGVNARRGVEF